MCEEESDDQEAVAKLFEINDSIHRTIERYKLIKKGDLDAASKIPKGTLGTSTGVSKSADNELSLIDLDGGSEPNEASTPNRNVRGPQSLEDDLLGLSFENNIYGKGGGIALAFGANSSEWPPAAFTSELDTNLKNVRCSRTVITVILYGTQFRESPYTKYITPAFAELDSGETKL